MDIKRKYLIRSNNSLYDKDIDLTQSLSDQNYIDFNLKKSMYRSNVKEKDIYNGSRYLEIKQDFEEDCEGFEYIPSTLEPTSRTIAIGDIHGDIEVAVKVLEIGKCIKKVETNTINSVILKNKYDIVERFIWIGGDTIVVQVGDQVDRCRPVGDHICVLPNSTIDDEASDVKILKFYTDIDRISRKSGGRVISLLGNHELMNVSGKMQYVSFMGLLEFATSVDLSKVNTENKTDYMKYVDNGLQNRRNAFSNKLNTNINRKEPLNEFLGCTRTSAIIIGKILFVHGGMIEKMASSYHLDDLNKIVRKWLLGKLTDEVANRELLKTNLEKKQNDNDVKFNFKERLNLLLNSGSKGISIFWNRIMGQIPGDIIVNDLSENSKEKIKNKCDKLLEPVFSSFGDDKLKVVVVGHTPQMLSGYKFGINSACDKRIWRTDIGASKAFDVFRENSKQRIEVLEIIQTDVDNYKYNILS